MESSQHEAVTLPVVVLFPSVNVFMYAVVKQFCSKVVVYLVAETLLTIHRPKYVVVSVQSHETETHHVVEVTHIIHILTYAVITECAYGEVTQHLAVGQLPLIILLKHVVVEEELVHQVLHIHLAVGVNFTTGILTFAVIGCIYEATAQDVV